MAFKMKKPSMTQGTARYKAACEAIKLNRDMDASSLPDGRAKSSAFQKSYEQAYKDAWKKGWTKKGESQEDYIKRAKAENIKKYGTTEPTKAVNEINKATGGSSTKADLAESKKKVDAGEGVKLKTGPKTLSGDDAKKPMSTPPGKTPKISNEKLISSKTVDKKRNNKTVTTTAKNDAKGSSKEVVKDKKNKTKTTYTSKDADTGKETKITSKVKKDKKGNVRKEKDTVVADGNVSKRTTKYDKEGNVKKSKVKNRKTFGETKVGKFLSGKKNKDEKPSPATKYKSSGTKKKSVASKPSDLLVGDRKNLPQDLKAKISAAPKKGCAQCNYGKSKCTCK